MNFREGLLLVFTSSLVFLVSGCLKVSTSAVNLLASTKGQSVSRSVPYGDKSHQLLNVFAPKDLGGTEAEPGYPVVVFFHGGGWSSGSKDEYRFVAEPFTTEGYVVVIPDYGKYPEFRFPSFMHDAAKVIGWIEKNIDSYGGDREQVFLLGHSSGAHMATLLLTDRSYLREAGVMEDYIRGAVGLAGPYDFVPEEPRYKEIFAAAGSDAASAMPASYVDGTQKPMLLLYGLDDDTVGMFNIESMIRKVKAHGGHLECRFYKETGHVGIVAAFSLLLRGRAPVVQDTLEFFSRLRSGEGIELASASLPCAQLSSSQLR